MKRARAKFRSIVAVSVLLTAAGCTRKAVVAPSAGPGDAKTLFEQTEKQYHLPSADAKGAEKQKLLDQAAAGYETLLKRFSGEQVWAAQALRSLGNVRAEQGRLDDAIKLYGRLEKEYPEQGWEILEGWKTAGDLLWEANRRDEARIFYNKIVTRFDNADSPAIYKTIVRGARNRLGDPAGVTRN